MAMLARQMRMHRLRHEGSQGLVVVAMDHGIGSGPIARNWVFDDLVGEIAAGGADAVVLHKGSVGQVAPHRFVQTRLIVHLSAGTDRGPDPYARCLVTSVEEALRLGADAVSVHVNLGAPTEQQQLADFAHVAEQCDRWQLPLLAMIYARGPAVVNPRDPDLIAHCGTVAVELGADLVKLPYPGSIAELVDITRSCPIPVLVAGGPRMEEAAQLTDFVGAVMAGGAGGVAIGRNVFQADAPGATTRKIVDVVHGHGWEQGS